MYRIVKLTLEQPQRTTVAATRNVSISNARRLMKQKAEQHLLPDYQFRIDQTVIGGYYADGRGDCIAVEPI